jgi:hypothetical protein
MAGIVPKRALLRIEVRDEAGNLGSYQLNEPINLQGLNPAGRIRGFAPAATAPPSGSSPGYSSGESSNAPASSPYGTPPSGSSSDPSYGAGFNSGASRIPLFGTRRR